MADYIDRAALLEGIARMSEWDDDVKQSFLSAALCRAVLKYVQKFPASDVVPTPKWISTKNRLPNPETECSVLALVSGQPKKNIILDHAYQIAGYYADEGWVIDEYPEWENATVHCWMPLPELPKEDNDGLH